MPVKDIATLLISFLAFGVAAYGIVERRRAGYSTLRVRITELIAEIQELNVDAARYDVEHPDADWEAHRAVGGSMAGRRALLTYQALSLLDRLRRSRQRPSPLTAEEHAALAWSLMELRDVAAAREQWEDALALHDRSTPIARAASHNGYAQCLLELEADEQARVEFRRAIDEYPDGWDRFCTVVSWMQAEWARGDADRAAALLVEAQELAAKSTPWRSSAQRVLAEVGGPV